MTPGYNYRTVSGEVCYEPDDNSKAKQYCMCGCGAVGNRVVHGAPDEVALLLTEACMQRLIRAATGRRP